MVSQKITFNESVYTYQIDYSRHVSNIVYIQWMENGRIKLLEDAGLAFHETGAQGYVPVLIETNIKYKKPIILGDTVAIHLWLSKLTRLYAIMEFEFYKNGNVLAATGTQKGVYISLKTKQPIRLSNKQIKLFEPYLLSE